MIIVSTWFVSIGYRWATCLETAQVPVCWKERQIDESWKHQLVILVRQLTAPEAVLCEIVWNLKSWYHSVTINGPLLTWSRFHSFYLWDFQNFDLSALILWQWRTWLESGNWRREIQTLKISLSADRLTLEHCGIIWLLTPGCKGWVVSEEADDQHHCGHRIQAEWGQNHFHQGLHDS